MGARKLVAILLLAGGVLALVYGGFTYTKESHDVKPVPSSSRSRRRSG